MLQSSLKKKSGVHGKSCGVCLFLPGGAPCASLRAPCASLRAPCASLRAPCASLRLPARPLRLPARPLRAPCAPCALPALPARGIEAKHCPHKLAPISEARNGIPRLALEIGASCEGSEGAL